MNAAPLFELRPLTDDEIELLKILCAMLLKDKKGKELDGRSTPSKRL